MNLNTAGTGRPKGRVVGALAATAAIGATALAGGGSAAYAGGPVGSDSGASTRAAAPHARLHLATSSPELKRCYPHARANVNVKLTTDDIGKDTFTIKAAGLKPRTTFTVFLLEQAGAPFGAAEYIGDFTTNRWGKAKNTYKLIVEEAFAFNNETGDRTDLNSVGFWFGDPKADDSCLGAGSPVTGFDGDASAGVQMMNSGRHLLP